MIQKAPPFPAALERRYRIALIALLNAQRRIVKSVVLPAYSEALAERRTDSFAESRSDAWYDTLRSVVAQLSVATQGAIAEMRGVAEGVAAYQTKSWAEKARELVGIRGMVDDPGIGALTRAWSEANATLIGSVAQKYQADVARVVTEGVMSGRGSRVVAKDLEAAYGVNESRAKLIARTETAKLNGQVSQQRQTSIGISEYTWRTAGDERVRKSHRAMQGKICRWDDASVYREEGSDAWVARSSIGGYEGHPGSDFQCRCLGAGRVAELIADLPDYTGPRRGGKK